EVEQFYELKLGFCLRIQDSEIPNKARRSQTLYSLARVWVSIYVNYKRTARVRLPCLVVTLAPEILRKSPSKCHRGNDLGPN
ncbi:unnamed protein product, partial [Ixodes pacificus]